MRVVLKPILPDMRIFLNTNIFEREMKDALDHTINIVNDDFKATVKTWTKPASFDKKGARKVGGKLEAQTSTSNQIYFFLTRGTKKNYPIPRSGTANLSFRSGYRAKTRVRVVGSRGGGSFGPRVFAKKVIHPGIDARDFDKEIAKRRQRNMTNLVRLGIMRSFRYGGIK